MCRLLSISQGEIGMNCFRDPYVLLFMCIRTSSSSPHIHANISHATVPSLKYPANPNTNLREEFEQLAKQRALEREQRAKYAEEVQRMQENARRSREGREAALKGEAATADRDARGGAGGRPSWRSWFRSWGARGRAAEANVTVESNQTSSAP